jgi:hypothetical protein
MDALVLAPRPQPFVVAQAAGPAPVVIADVAATSRVDPPAGGVVTAPADVAAADGGVAGPAGAVLAQPATATTAAAAAARAG